MERWKKETLFHRCLRWLIHGILAVALRFSPYSRFSDGLLDLVWLDHVPNVAECVDAVAHAYSGKILGCKVFGWKRVRDIEITRARKRVMSRRS